MTPIRLLARASSAAPVPRALPLELHTLCKSPAVHRHCSSDKAFTLPTHPVRLPRDSNTTSTNYSPESKLIDWHLCWTRTVTAAFIHVCITDMYASLDVSLSLAAVAASRYEGRTESHEQLFLHANWEQQTKDSAVVDGTSCCVILECPVTSIACITSLVSLLTKWPTTICRFASVLSSNSL